MDLLLRASYSLLLLLSMLTHFRESILAPQRQRSYLLIILFFVVLDQITKGLVLHSITLYETIEIIPGFFNLTYLYNTGAAFGMFHDSNRFFIAVSLLALFVLLWQQRHFAAPLMRWGWILIISGIIGNLTDRFFHGHVIDFLDFQFSYYHWPAFNIADSCICVATGFFLLASFLPESNSDLSKKRN